MKIFLRKFGNILVSRPAGKEAYLAFQPVLREMKKQEPVEVDFEGVDVLTPSWADEFLTPLNETFGRRIHYGHTENPSVKATLEILGDTKNG
ncbi:STAS-like domain-containing protein [Candidatus Peregrinibacteria bacterium]|nr:STAS-like domain-containing protein [Candidatus Peregrinibacteria bacterium]